LNDLKRENTVPWVFYAVIGVFCLNVFSRATNSNMGSAVKTAGGQEKLKAALMKRRLLLI
jgi:hypothetical protein